VGVVLVVVEGNCDEIVVDEVSIAARDLNRSARSLDDPALGIADCVLFNPGFPPPPSPSSPVFGELAPLASSGKCQDASTATSDT